jgi:hypothetical protein
MKILILTTFTLLAACAWLHDPKSSAPAAPVARHSEANVDTNLVALGEGMLALAKRLVAQPDREEPR